MDHGDPIVCETLLGKFVLENLFALVVRRYIRARRRCFVDATK